MQTDLHCIACDVGVYEYIPPVSEGGGAYYCRSCGDVQPLDKCDNVSTDTTPPHNCRYRDALRYLLDPEGLGLLATDEVRTYIHAALDETIGG